MTFRYCGEAKNVELQGDFYYIGKEPSKYTDNVKKLKMRKDSTGCFSVTTQPLQPEFYTYCFNVDGNRIPDPLNNDTAWQKQHLWSVLTIGGTEHTDLYLQPERQGQMVRTRWYCENESLYRRLNVYLPADYDPNGEPLDAIYLLHGINGYEGAWSERGRVIQIMENMVAQGQMKPMVVVMPDINAFIQGDGPSLHTMWYSVTNFCRQQKARYLEQSLLELCQHIDTTYNVTGRNVIAGLSDGARLASNMAVQAPEDFYFVGMFTPVMPKKQIPDSTAMHCNIYGCTAYSVMLGKTDMFYNDGYKIHQRMEKAGLPHTLDEFIYGHYWRTWRECLIRLFTYLSQPQS